LCAVPGCDTPSSAMSGAASEATEGVQKSPRKRPSPPPLGGATESDAPCDLQPTSRARVEVEADANADAATDAGSGLRTLADLGFRWLGQVLVGLHDQGAGLVPRSGGVGPLPMFLSPECVFSPGHWAALFAAPHHPEVAVRLIQTLWTGDGFADTLARVKRLNDLLGGARMSPTQIAPVSAMYSEGPESALKTVFPALADFRLRRRRDAAGACGEALGEYVLHNVANTLAWGCAKGLAQSTPEDLAKARTWVLHLCCTLFLMWNGALVATHAGVVAPVVRLVAKCVASLDAAGPWTDPIREKIFVGMGAAAIGALTRVWTRCVGHGGGRPAFDWDGYVAPEVRVGVPQPDYVLTLAVLRNFAAHVGALVGADDDWDVWIRDLAGTLVEVCDKTPVGGAPAVPPTPEPEASGFTCEEVAALFDDK